MAHRVAVEAEADLDEIWFYIASNSSIEIADRLVDALTARFALLATYPNADRERANLRPGLRVFPVGDYLVLYQLQGSDVLIVRVVRGSRDLDLLLADR